MRKLIFALSIFLGVASMNTQAEGWEFLAGGKPGYKAEPIASLMFGQMDFDGSDSAEVGGGPGLGYLYSDDTADRFAINLGASIHYTGLPVFLGAELRTQFTTENNGEDLNNNRMAVKIGYAF